MIEGGQFVCRCECGGDVMGVSQLGKLWTWCTKCTPVMKVAVPAAPAGNQRGAP